jgi:hypothetical protein
MSLVQVVCTRAFQRCRTYLHLAEMGPSGDRPSGGNIWSPTRSKFGQKYVMYMHLIDIPIFGADPAIVQE